MLQLDNIAFTAENNMIDNIRDRTQRNVSNIIMVILMLYAILSTSIIIIQYYEIQDHQYS